MTKNIATLEMENGNPAQLGLYIRGLIKSQVTVDTGGFLAEVSFDV
jgi:hypothetical protein